mgnify:CR=1 FL=1
MEKDTTTRWRLTKLLNEDKQDKRKTVIESQNEHLAQKRAANCFAHSGEHSETPQRKNKACQKRNKKQLSENIPADGCMTDAIQKDELEAELGTLRNKKAPGPDGVTNDIFGKRPQ